MLKKQPKKIHPVSGFRVRSVTDIESAHASLVRLTHKRTGLDVLHVATDDTERMFCFIVPTPCPNDTGVAHILEHSVLAGSKHFPLKDPFVRLLKGSMKTLLNASTSADHTRYYGASTNPKDFMNIFRVYADAVFAPLLRKEVFLQEGWHLETGDRPDDTDKKNGAHPAKIVGVVFNEMIGRETHPETLFFNQTLKSLFADTYLRFEVGGKPESIIDLTYRDFLDFYSRFYHPSSMKLFLCGDFSRSLESVLTVLDREYLGLFDRRKPGRITPQQKSWNTPRRVTSTYPAPAAQQSAQIISEGEPAQKSPVPDARSFASVNWLLPSSTDPVAALSFEIIEEILVGHAGAPLRKALQESGLGEDIVPNSGLGNHLPRMFFTAGLRSVRMENVPAVEKLVLDTLSSLVTNTIEPREIEAAVCRLEFRERESILPGNSPASQFLGKVLRTWIEDRSLKNAVDFERTLAIISKKLRTQPGYLESLISRHLLDNTSRITLVMEPAPDADQKTRETIKNKIDAITGDPQKMADASCDRALLDAYRAASDPPEAVASLPELAIEDLPASPERFPVEDHVAGGSVPVLYHDLATNGIVYIDYVFDITSLEPSLVPYLSLFGKAVCSSGTRNLTYDLAARELALLTGGFHPMLLTDFFCGTSTTKSSIIFRLKVTEPRLDAALPLIHALLCTARFDDAARMKDILIEMRNRYRSSIIPAGNHYAGLRACSGFALPNLIEELTGGISQAVFLKHCVAGINTGLSNGLEGCIRELESVRAEVIRRDRLTLNITTDRKTFMRAMPLIEKQLVDFDSMTPLHRPPTDIRPRPLDAADTQGDRLEAFAYPSGICFNAIAIPGSPYSSDMHPIESVLAHVLSTEYLWEHVRQRGGAYGAHASSSGTGQVFSFTSYRDPNIKKTLDAFRGSLEFMSRNPLDRDEIVRAIIGTVGVAERPYSPSDKSLVSLKMRLYGITDELRQARRRTVLDCSAHDLATAAGKLLEGFDQGHTVVIGPRENIAAESADISALAQRTVELDV